VFERLTNRRQAVAAAATVLVILFVTLIPSGSGPPLPFSYDLGVGRRWLADGILNLLLFVPLGLTLGWNSRSTWISVACGLILSTAIEMAQTLVPGRDPELSDIVFNTLGTVVGALLARRPYAWLTPDPQRSSILASIAVGAVGVVMAATVLLLSPIGPRIVIRSGNDLQLQYPTRAGAIGLDEPEYWVRGAFRPGENGEIARVSLSRERNHWRVTIGSNEQVIVGPTIGQGWTLLEYPNAIGRRWGSMLNGVWVFVLSVAIGFWTRGRFRMAVGATLIALLLLIPVFAGVERTSFAEWIGAMMGFWVGTALGRGAQRLDSLSKIRRCAG
jgi:glycopeptide antibiotics resistance protein